MLKRGKQERYLQEVLSGVVRRYGSQVTWNALARDLSIDHPATVADYLGLLSRMDVLVVQHALREDRLAAAPKKARKVAFSDPFIFHAVRSWLDPVADPFTGQVQPILGDPEWAGRLAEACAVAHHHRLHPTFYIKGDGEVDVAFVTGDGFQPVEVKWTAQIRAADLKQALQVPPQHHLLEDGRGPHPRAAERTAAAAPAPPWPLAALRDLVRRGRQLPLAEVTPANSRSIRATAVADRGPRAKEATLWCRWSRLPVPDSTVLTPG